MKKRISQVYKVCILLIVVLMCVCTVAYAVSTYIDEGNTSYSYRLVPTGVGNQNDYSSGSGGYGGGYAAPRITADTVEVTAVTCVMEVMAVILATSIYINWNCNIINYMYYIDYKK